MLLVRAAVLLQLPREQEVHRHGEVEAEARRQRLHDVAGVDGVPVHRRSWASGKRGAVLVELELELSLHVDGLNDPPLA